MNEDFAKGYVAGLIDGEGSVVKTGQGTRIVRVGNCDPDIIETYIAACEILKIETGKIQINKTASGRDYFCVPIYGKKNFQRILDIVPFVSTEKRNKLQNIVDAYVERIDPSLEQIAFLKRKGVSNRAIADAFGYKSHDQINKLVKRHNLV